MDRRLYLIGTRHTAQKGLLAAPEDEYYEFRRLLEQAVSTHVVRTIGEEMSQQVLGDVTFSIARRLCEQRGINHLFCDPDEEERAVLELIDGDVSAREDEWLRRLQYAESPVLFICGATHVQTFATKCRHVGISVTVLYDDWEPVGGTLGKHTMI